MKSSILLFAATFFILFGTAKAQTETKLTSQVKEVTLFLSGAQVFTEASGNFPSGESILVVTGLSPFILENSIQVKGQGNFTIQAVNKRMDYLETGGSADEVKKLRAEIDKIEAETEIDAARLSVLSDKEELLSANKKISGSQSNLSVSELEGTLAFYDKSLMAIKTEEIEIKERKSKKDLQIRRLSNQIRSLEVTETESTSQVLVRIKADSPGTATLTLNYLVGNAGWYPKYDVRVNDVSEPLELNYKAEVYQNTGVDWKDVRMKFSNGNPNKSGLAPDLDKWELNYARYTTISRNNSGTLFEGIVVGVVVDNNGDPLPGVSVLFTGSTIGTATDLDGRYSIAVPSGQGSLVFSFVGFNSEEVQIRNRPNISLALLEDTQTLNEVVVTGYSESAKRSLQGKVAGVAMVNEASAIETIFRENQTTVEIEVEDPYSISSEGPKTLIDLRQYDIPAEFQYRVIPKLDTDVYLIAQINDWSQYSLLDGESNLYFEDGYVGRSILATAASADSLSISMGRDQSILVSREKNQEFSRKRSIGSNITESREFQITVRNNKSVRISIQVLDQVPVSVNSSITVEVKELSKGDLNEQDGIVTWNLELDPGEQEVLTLGYEVKYPKREKVIIE